jgi:lipooligosaccharide transport system permease protein
MNTLPLGLSHILAVFFRQYIVWRKLIWPAMVTNVGNPVLFLFAFGFGLGRFIDTMNGVDYMSFIVPGMVAYAAMFAASFETTIGSFTRYFLLKNWDAVLATPVSLRELLMGEALWASCKAMISAISVLVVGWLWGGIPSPAGALISLPFIFLSAICFSCVGLTATAYASGYEFFSYFFTFWVTPMFVFCGVFFEISRFPEAIQIIAWILPMTHIIAVIRPLCLGLPIDPTMILLHTAYMFILCAIAFTLAHKKMRQKLFD